MLHLLIIIIGSSSASSSPTPIRLLMIFNAPWHPQCASDALLERRRDWTLLDLLGPHDCVFPGCRGEQAGACPHQNPPLPQDVSAETLLADLDVFYELLISEFRKRVLSVPDTVITSNSSVFSPSEESLRSLRADWHSDERLTGRWRSLRKRLSALFSLRGPANYGELLNRLESLQTLWGTSPAESADTSEDRLSGEQEQLFPTLSTSSSPVEPHIQPVTHSSPTSGDLTQLRPMNRLATVSSWVCELERQMNTEILPELQRGLVRGLDERIRPNPFFLSKVEACAEKMREVAVDRVIMAKSGLNLPASSYESIRKALQLGWLVVREYIMANCVEVPVIWSGLCGRHLHLLETYLSQTHSLDFDNKAIEKKKSELCQEYVTQNLATLAASGTEVSTWNECGRLYSTHGPLQSILLSRHLRNQRAPVAFTVFSLPDVSSVGYPRLPSEANETSEVFRLPGLKYGLIYLRSWMSMPELWSDSRDPVTPTVIETVDLCHYTKSVEEGDGEEVIGFQPTVEVLTPRTDPLTTFSYSEGSSSVSLRTLDKPNSTQVITVADGEDVIDSGFLMDTEGMSSIDRGGREGRTHSFLTENSFSEVPDDLSLDENWEFRNYEQSTEIFQLSGQPIKIPHIPFRGLIRSPESHQSFSLCSSSLMESHHPQTMILQPSVSMQEDTTHSEPDLNTASLKSWPILAASRRFMTLGRCPKSLPELAVGCETRPIIDAVLRPLKLSATSENSSTHDTTIPADRPARSVASQDLTESTDEIEDQEREEDGGDGREDQTDETARREGRESSAGIANILALSKDDDKMEEEKEEEEEEEEEQTGLEDDVRTLMKLLRSMSPDEVVRELTGTSPWMPLNPKDSELQHNNIQPEHSRISHPITNTELTSRVSDDQAEVVSQARNELKTGVPTAMLRTPKTPEGGKVQDRDGELKKSGPAANGVETSSPHLEEPCKQPVSGTVFESEQRPQMTEPATMYEMVGDLENLRVSTKSDSSCSPGIEIPSRIPDPSKLAKKKDTEGACWHPQHISKVDDEGKNCHLKADASDAAMEMLELSKLCSPPEELSDVSASIAAVRGDHLLPGDTQKIPAKEPVRTLKSSPVGEAERVRDLGSDSETEMPELSMFWSSPQEDAAEGPISGEEGESSGRAKEEVMGDAPEDRMEEAIGKGDVRSTIALQDEPRTELGEEERHDSRVSGKIPIERPAAEISNDAQETERNITSDESPTRDATTGPPIGWCTIMPRARLYKTTFSATPDRHDGTSQLYTVVDFPPHHEQPPLEAYAPLVCSAPDQSGSCHLSTEAGDPSDWTNREAAGVVEPAHEALPATAAVAGSAGNGVEYAHLPPAYKTDRTGDASFPMNGETVEDNEGVSVKRTEQSMDSRPVGLAGPLGGNLEGATAGPIKFPSQTVNSEGGELEQLFFQRASVGEVQSSDNESQRTTPVTEKFVGYQPPSCDAETEGPHDEPPMVVIEKALLPAIFQQDDWIREFYPPSDHPEPERKAVNELQRETVAK
ncbi:unnamed protein product, partial [Schistocephalus solidus]|uniref:Espin like b n=1 Tax=Schistocephalus solidus TaxID=70667 RepID=A0A183TJI4_SCHSO